MNIVLDAGPLIYLAKLDALDVLPASDRTAVVPPFVWAEVARPELAFRHPEVTAVDQARLEGWLAIEQLRDEESSLADELGGRVSGLHRGELECLALASRRGWPVCVHERQAARLARTLGVETVHLVELLVDGTPDPERLTDRIRRFARLTNLAMTDLDELLRTIGERRS